MDSAERGKRRKAHRYRADCAVHGMEKGIVDDGEVERLRRDVGYSAAGRAAKITNLQSKNRSGQVSAENELVQAPIVLATETSEVGGNINVLVDGDGEVVGEATPGEARRDLRACTRRTADASEPGTCETKP